MAEPAYVERAREILQAAETRLSDLYEKHGNDAGSRLVTVGKAESRVSTATERLEAALERAAAERVPAERPFSPASIEETMARLEDDALANEWRASLSQEERDAIDEYVKQGAHRDINRFLRTGSLKWGQPLGEHEQEVLRLLRKALGRPQARAPFDFNTYRYIGPDDLRELLGVTDLSQALGRDFFEPGFSSTSIAGRAVGRYETVLRISVPEGTRGAYLGELGGFSEAEFLLPDGLRFRVTRFSVENGSFVLDVEIVAL